MARRVRMIVFGHHGAGKTVFLGSGAEDPRIWPGLLLNFEGGLMSIESKVHELNPDGETKVKLGDPQEGKWDAVHIQSWDMFEDMFAVINDTNDSRNVYKAVAVDSLTEINYLNLRRAVVSAIKKERREDQYTPQLQDYGRSNAELKYVFREFRDLPIHSFFTALGHEDKDEVTGAIIVAPALVGKLAAEIPGLVDIVGYIRARQSGGKVIREMIWQPDGKIRAKDRSEGGQLGDSTEWPTIPGVLDDLKYSKSAVVSTTAPVQKKTFRRAR